MYPGHMSGAGCTGRCPQNGRAKLPANVPGHPDRYHPHGAEPPPRQAGTHLGNSVRVEGQEGRDEKAAIQSLIGTLSQEATVVIAGRAFLRRMIDTMKIPRCQHHHVRLNQEFQSDVQWWAWMEWEVNAPHIAGCTHFLVRRIWVLGLRSSQSHPRLVPTAVARHLETAPHSSQRNGASSSRGGSMGTRLELFHSPRILGQYGSGQCYNRGAGPGSAPHAPSTVPTLLLCSLWHSSAIPTYSRGSEYHGRCTIYLGTSVMSFSLVLPTNTIAHTSVSTRHAAT